MKNLSPFLVILTLFSLSFASAALSNECKLTASLINQDPYPAIPGEYAKLVFQLDGINDLACGKVSFELLSLYPISLDPGVSSKIDLNSGIYANDYKSSLVAPFKVRIDKEAIDGDNTAEVRFARNQISGETVYQVQKFNISVQNSQTDFEVSIKDYSFTTNKLTLQILNVGKYNIEALSVEVPKQDRIKIFGTNKNIVGSLDANEDTTFDFNAIPSEGDIDLKISYTDQSNVRRTIDKVIHFDPSYFELTKNSSMASWKIYSLIVIILGVIFFFWKKIKKYKKKELN